MIDNCGQVVQSWTSDYNAGMMAYLRDDGCLVRAGRTGNPNFGAGGAGGIIEMFNWEGDFNGNGIVEVGDLLAFLGNMGITCAP